MKKLIINADDFGLHPLINKGIIEGHQKGKTHYTTLFAKKIQEMPREE